MRILLSEDPQLLRDGDGIGMQVLRFRAYAPNCYPGRGLLVTSQTLSVVACGLQTGVHLPVVHTSPGWAGLGRMGAFVGQVARYGQLFEHSPSGL